MAEDLSADDVLEPSPSWTVLMGRGLRKRCPRCGARGLYRGWFHMLERCPACGFKFEREPGFFVGAYLINFAIVEGLLFVLVMAFVVVLANDSRAGIVVPLVIGAVLAVAAPLAFYPYSRTIWSAIDLAATPLELAEIVEAREAVTGEGKGDSKGEGDRGR